MDMVSGAKRRRIAEEEEEHHEDHISRLPDAVLGEIVSLLRTKDGGRTQAIASRWRHLWRAAPLNLDLNDPPPIQYQCPNPDLDGDDDDDDEDDDEDEDDDVPSTQRPIPLAKISGILSSHPGPGRRFCIPRHYLEHDAHCASRLDAWLRSPALDGLQELDFHYGSPTSRHTRRAIPAPPPPPPPPLPESARRFSSTLRVASFGGCAFRDENGLHLPHLTQLSLLSVEISETSLNALLAGCPLLQSLMMTQSIGCKRVRIVSPTLRSIGVRVCGEYDNLLNQLIIEDAPSLERFLLLGYSFDTEMFISVISAPKLKILGQLQCLQGPTLELGNSVFKGSCVVNSTTVLPSVKVLAVTHISLSLDEVIAFMKCFPCLENLYIRISTAYNEDTKSRVTNVWRQKYQNLIGTLDIHLKKIVLSTYQGNKAHVNFATFFVLNARVLESMVLKLDVNKYHNKAWIEKQKALLQFKERASRGAQFDFVYHFGLPIHSDHMWYDQVHDLSTADPFVGFDYWATG